MKPCQGIFIIILSKISRQRADHVFLKGLHVVPRIWNGQDLISPSPEFSVFNLLVNGSSMDGGEEARDYINKEPERDKHGGCAIKQGYASRQSPSCWQEASSYRTEHQVREQTHRTGCSERITWKQLKETVSVSQSARTIWLFWRWGLKELSPLSVVGRHYRALVWPWYTAIAVSRLIVPDLTANTYIHRLTLPNCSGASDCRQTHNSI